MRHIKVLLGISIVLLVIGCKKSPELETEYLPIFSSNVEVNVTETKIGLKAFFTQQNTSSNENIGFEWSEKYGTNTTMFTAGATNSGELELQIDTALRQSNIYKVRAWIKVGEKMFFSNYAYFTGLGYPAPVITSLNKDYTYWGETIIIKGKYFSSYSNENSVKIDNQDVPVQYVSSNEIHIKMPSIEQSGKVKLLINVLGKIPLNDVEIENYRPEIFSVSPLETLINGEIIIKGKFRSEYRNLILPVQNTGYYSSYGQYQIIKYTDDEIIIKGGNFINCDTLYKINFQLQEYEGYNYSILETGFSVKRTGYWSRLNNTPFNSLDKALSCNGMGYVIQFNGYKSNFPFWRYDPQLDQWTKLSPFPGNFRIDPVFVECNGFIYCGLGKKNNIFYELMTDFWKFDPVANTWSKCADLNFKSTDGVSIFGANIQNTVYVFSEWNNQKAKYIPESNSWVISDCDVPRLHDYATNFLYKGEYYFSGDITYNSFYKYNPNSLKFVNLYIQNWIAGSTFEYKGRVFAKSLCLLSEIDFENKRVIDLPEYTDNVSSESPGSELFILNDKPYFFFQPNGLSTVKIE